MKASQLRQLIEEVLIELRLNSTNAVELLMLTAAQESHLGHYLMQVNNGPAKGIFQMEPATEKDIWENYLAYKEDLRKSVHSLMGAANFDHLQLKGNLLYQIAMARIHYLRVYEKLPNHLDVMAMARYWKKYYNTYLGKGRVEDAMYNYRRLVYEEPKF